MMPTTTRPRRLASFALAAAMAIGGAPLVAPTRAMAEPGGCLKYGAAGAVGGHLMHHGVLGAVGGCATGMYARHRYRKTQRSKARAYDQEHAQDRNGMNAGQGRGMNAGPGPDGNADPSAPHSF